MPSRADFYGVTLVEGLAHGLPVVASDTGGNRAMVVNDLPDPQLSYQADRDFSRYQTGWLLDAAAPAGAYAAAVAALFSGAAPYSKIAENCRKHYYESFDWPVAARLLRAALERARRDDLSQRLAQCAVSE